jgi:RHS repeat-associated protein
MLGVERDPTGLVYMRGRYYDPELGRFIQMDPLGLEGGDVNLYRYCQNDAIGWVDLDGCQAVVSQIAAPTAAEVAAFESQVAALQRLSALSYGPRTAQSVGQMLKQTVRIAWKSGLLKKIGQKVVVKIAALAARIAAKHVAANALNAVPWVLAALVIWDVVDIIWTIMRPLMKPLWKVLKATIRAIREIDPTSPFDPDKYKPYKQKPEEKVTPTKECNLFKPKPNPCQGLLERKKELEKEIEKCKEEAQKNNPFWKMIYQEDCDKKAKELEKVLEEMKDAGCSENIDYPS